MWFDQRGHLPARSKARRPGGLNGFFGPLSFISAGMCGPEMRLLVNIDSQMLLNICATARSLPLLNGLPKIITPATMLTDS